MGRRPRARHKVFVFKNAAEMADARAQGRTHPGACEGRLRRARKQETRKKIIECVTAQRFPSKELMTSSQTAEQRNNTKTGFLQGF